MTSLLLTYNKRIVIRQRFPEGPSSDEKPGTARRRRARSARTARVARSRSTTSIQQGDRGRVQRLLATLRHHARMNGVALPFTANTAYINTIRSDEQTPLPGSQEIERRIKSLVRWNAMAMVVRANRVVGRHRRPHLDVRLGGDAVRGRLQPFFRGKGTTATATSSTSRGTPRRASTRARFSKGACRSSSLENFRRETATRRRPVVVSAPLADAGLLGIPDGLDGARPDHGDLPGALQPLPRGSRARSSRPNAKVWAFLGDGETDEPEALGAITLAAREKLDNLIFVINCNLQRLDGPVRGNGQIIQELEAVFRGAGWNVIKVLWGSDWDPLLAKDHDGLLVEAHGRGRRRPVPEVRRRVRRLHARAFFGRRSAAARHGQAPVGRSAQEACGSAATTRSRSTTPTRRPSSTRASRPSSWPARSRATASARRAKARTSPTSRRR